MYRPIILKRHIITLLPDIFYFLVSMIFFWEFRYLSTIQGSILQSICEIAAMLFLMLVLTDILNWISFRVHIDAECIAIRRFWIFERRCCNHTGRQIRLQQSQSALDALFDKGALEIVAPHGQTCTLRGLANFSKHFPSVSQPGPQRRPTL